MLGQANGFHFRGCFVNLLKGIAVPSIIHGNIAFLAEHTRGRSPGNGNFKITIDFILSPQMNAKSDHTIKNFNYLQTNSLLVQF